MYTRTLIRIRIKRNIEMSETEYIATSEDESDVEKFYLPAFSARPSPGRIEAIVSDLFDFHGVVLIPDSYNK